jgi:FlaA1/EpsC-like NDP-sugar epimerase
MISLMGLTVRDEENLDGDIEIVYTGLRPAEKLFEELLIGTNVTGTEHPMIMRAIEHSLPWQQVQGVLEDLRLALSKFDCEKARHLLMQAVAEYQPALALQDLVWARKAEASHVEVRNVTDLQSRRLRGPVNPPLPHG